MPDKFVYIVAFRDLEFVMVRHRSRAWEMPGGRVEAGESYEEAARREFLEETGMVLRDIVDEIHIPGSGGKVLVGFAGSRVSSPLSPEIAEVETFSSLPRRLSFPSAEYEPVLARARAIVESFKAGKNIDAPASPRTPIETE